MLTQDNLLFLKSTLWDLNSFCKTPLWQHGGRCLTEYWEEAVYTRTCAGEIMKGVLPSTFSMVHHVSWGSQNLCTDHYNNLLTLPWSGFSQKQNLREWHKSGQSICKVNLGNTRAEVRKWNRKGRKPMQSILATRAHSCWGGGGSWGTYLSILTIIAWQPFLLARQKLSEISASCLTK